MLTSRLCWCGSVVLCVCVAHPRVCAVCSFSPSRCRPVGWLALHSFSSAYAACNGGAAIKREGKISHRRSLKLLTMQQKKRQRTQATNCRTTIHHGRRHPHAHCARDTQPQAGNLCPSCTVLAVGQHGAVRSPSNAEALSFDATPVQLVWQLRSLALARGHGGTALHLHLGVPYCMPSRSLELALALAIEPKRQHEQAKLKLKKGRK